VTVVTVNLILECYGIPCVIRIRITVTTVTCHHLPSLSMAGEERAEAAEVLVSVPIPPRRAWSF
jgi:hypothetical protein